MQEIDLAQQRIICEESVLVWRRIMGLQEAAYSLQQHLDETFRMFIEREFPVGPRACDALGCAACQTNAAAQAMSE